MDVRQDQFGLQVWRGQVSTMNQAHQHSEIEINLVLQGGVEYLFAGQTVGLEAGAWVLFWGALPHRLIQAKSLTEMLWLTLPLAQFLRFDLPSSLTQPVLYGSVVRELNPSDHHRFQQWLEDFQGGQTTQDILVLELEARLRRLALKLQSQPNPNTKPTKHTDKAVLMAQFMANHYAQPIQVSEIAASVELHPNYASSLFKQTFGMTLLQYLTQHRMAHAQRLLATSDMPILAVAFEAGFGSSSRFYAAFEQAMGQSPLEYRKRVNHG